MVTQEACLPKVAKASPFFTIAVGVDASRTATVPVSMRSNTEANIAKYRQGGLVAFAPAASFAPIGKKTLVT